ncbi:MAG: long-chain acyl-CoA synthetase [Pirellulaceae bacterium]|jgi:long-chain acyl-CoA synthetase
MSGALGRQLSLNTASISLGPAPILAAADRYRGSIIDLDEGTTIGPDDFAATRQQLVALLKNHGLEPGDRVLLAVPNSPLFIVALTAILECEGSPLLVHSQTPSAELQRYAQRFGVRFLATVPKNAHNIEMIVSSTKQLSLDATTDLQWCRFSDDKIPSPSLELRGVPLHPTSGSTGLPKVALRPGFAAIEEARHYAETMAIDADDYVLSIPPLSHAYGYGTCVMLPLLTGASVVTTSQYSNKKMLAALQQFPITIMPNVPANIDLLALSPNIDYGKLRWMLAAGSMLTSSSAIKFRERVCIPVCPLYGTTETGGISVATAADDSDVDGRVGPPMDGVQVKVLPRNSADGIDPSIGKLAVRSSSMMIGYLDETGQVTSPLQDGWFETGDLARIEDDGVIHLRGRTGEMINVLGLKVVPCEVEETIARMPGVREVKVYGHQRLPRIEMVKAAVAVDPGITEMDVRQYCEENLVYYKRPQVVSLVDALPRSPAGKIVREDLP